MECDVNEITLNGKVYVEKGASVAKGYNGLKYVIVRTYSAGVFAGFLSKLDGKIATLLQARRLWYWDGAASLSQLAMEGVAKPENCKFPCEVSEVILTEVIEVLDCTEKAKKSIEEVKIWEM